MIADVDCNLKIENIAILVNIAFLMVALKKVRHLTYLTDCLIPKFYHYPFFLTFTKSLVSSRDQL